MSAVPTRKHPCPECHMYVPIAFVRNIKTQIDNIPAHGHRPALERYYFQNEYRVTEHKKSGILHRQCNGSGTLIELAFRGTRLAAMGKCKYCGGGLELDAKFCDKCGAPR